VAAGLVAVLATACGGVGGPAVLTGRADAGEGGLSITTDDHTYGGGFGFAWTDAGGTWHDRGRPDCLPPGASRQVRFAATEVTVEGVTWRPVVWLDCR
jgi:hypothetical protein